MRPETGLVRLVRSLVIGVFCTATATFAHVSAGGEIAAVAAVIVFAGASAVAWALSSRRVTPGQMVGLLVLCQLCVHLGCSMGTMNMSAWMLATHATATAVSALALAWGEAFVWRLAQQLAIRLRPTVISVALVPSHPALMPAAAPRALHDVRLAYSRSLRGPPYGSV